MMVIISGFGSAYLKIKNTHYPKLLVLTIVYFTKIQITFFKIFKKTTFRVFSAKFMKNMVLKSPKWRKCKSS